MKTLKKQLSLFLLMVMLLTCFSPASVFAKPEEDERPQEVGDAYPGRAVLVGQRGAHAPLDRLGPARDLHHRPLVDLGGPGFVRRQMIMMFAALGVVMV